MSAEPLPTVLVVDDEIRSQESLRRTLEEGFEVVAVKRAPELYRLQQENCQLAVELRAAAPAPA